MSKIVPFNHKDKPASRDPFANMLETFFDDAWFPLRVPELDSFKLDVKENEDRYTIEAELPGVKKKDITLDLNDGRLTIGVAEREIADEDKKKLVHRERSIYLADADGQKAEAKLKHGELIITVPKAKGAGKTEKIEIQ